MLPQSLTSATAAAILLFSNHVFADLGRPVLFNDGLSPHVDSSFWQNLKPTQSTWDQWGAGWIPKRCKDEVQNGGFSAGDVEVFNVHYTDCGSAWVFCRHKNAPLSQISLIDLFGRLPVHERQWVQHVIAVPGGGSAYMSSAVTVYQGSVGTPSVFQHETGHAVDFYKNGNAYSGTSAFRDAVAQDSCVPDGYSNSAYAEDYTQVSVLSLYEQVTPGGLDAIGANWRCLEKQKNVLDGFQRQDAMVPGGTCNRRWADSEIVSTTSTKRDGEAPARALTEDAENVFAIPFEIKTHVHTYKNLQFNSTEEANAVNRQAKWATEAAAAAKKVN